MGLITWGTERIPGVLRVETGPKPQNAIQTSLGREGSRNDRLGTRQVEFDSFDGGVGLTHGAETETNIRRLAYSDGLWSHIPGGLYLPPALVTDTTVDTQDISGFRAANKSAHALMSTLGQSNPRLYVVIGNELYQTEADNDPDLASVNSWTDTAYFAYEGVFNNTRYIVTGGGGDTDDILGIADPVSAPTTEAKILALTSGDWVGGGAYMRLGGPEFNILYGKIGGVSGLWWITPDQSLLTSFRPLVLIATRNDEGNIATVTDSEVLPSFVGQSGQGFTSNDAREGVWINLANATAEDTSYMQYRVFDSPSGSSTGLTSWAEFHYDVSSTIRPGEIVTGTAIRCRAKITQDGGGNGNGLDSARLSEAYLISEGSQTGGARADGSTLSTSEADESMGSSTDDWGASLEGSNANAFGVRIRFAVEADVDSTPDASGSVDIDTVGATFTHRELGDQAYIPLGGRSVGIDPFEPGDWYLLAPLNQDDATGHTVPRVLWRVRVVWDSSQERPVCTPEVMATGLDNVEAACFDDAGMLWVAGDNSTGIGKAVKRLDKSGGIEDMELFSGDGLGEDWGVVNMIGSGSYCVAELALEAGTTIQSWICTGPGVWSPISKRLTVGALPLRVSGELVDTHQHYRHRIYPDSTNIADSYQYHPINFDLNPLSHLDSVVKEDGVLTVQTALLDLLGPHEALKTLLIVQCDDAEVSATNTIRLRYRLTNSGSWTTITTFTANGARAALATPVKFSHMQLEIGLNHSTGTADTPKGLSFLIEGTSRWPILRRTTVFLNPGDSAFQNKYGVDGFEKLISNLQTLQETLPVQTLTPGAGLSFRADWTDYATQYEGVDNANRGVKALGDVHRLVFEEVVSE